jgi:hypothetical protein
LWGSDKLDFRELNHMKRFIIFPLILAFSVLCWSADIDRFLELTNNTGFVIAALYISDFDSDDWGDDFLDGRFLSDGETVGIALEELDSPLVNVRGRDDEGDTYTAYMISTESNYIELTINNIDPD